MVQSCPTVRAAGECSETYRCAFSNRGKSVSASFRAAKKWPYSFTAARAFPALSQLIHSLLIHLDILRKWTYHSPRMSTKEEVERIELLQGTLDLLILRTLAPGPAHGHAIAKTIERQSEDVLQVEQGSLYPALHRLIKRGWISVEDGTSENNRRAKFYRLTKAGRRQLETETERWGRISLAIAQALETP